MRTTAADRAALAREVAARALEHVERGWTQGAPSRRRDGQPAPVHAPDAFAFTANGALARAAREVVAGTSPAAGRLREVVLGIAHRRLAAAAGLAAAPPIPELRLLTAGWNDAPSRTKAEILAALGDAAR